MTFKMNSKMFGTTVAIALIAIGVNSAFADESFPSWNSHDTHTVGSCSGSNSCLANSASGGVNDIYVKCTGIGCSNDSYARNNGQLNPTVTTNDLEVTVDQSKVGMEIDIVYDGQMTTGFGSIAEYHAGLDLYTEVFGSWTRVSGCFDTLTAARDLTDSQTLNCDATNSGTNDYRASATHRAHSENWNLFVTTIVDFYDSGAGDSNKAETDRLEICNGVCT